MKLAFVVQRYGIEINGGAEQHCRYIAERLAKRHKVEVLSTCALDYITWANYYPKGISIINNIPVHRFPVKKKRDPIKFGKIQERTFYKPHTKEDEILWIEEEGPNSPSLIEYIIKNKDNYDYFIYFSYRYYHSYYGIKAIPDKSILVPTAENDGAIELSIFKELFNLPKAIIYNSYEEKRLIQAYTGNYGILGDIVGVGSIIPEFISKRLFLEKYNIKFPYVIYIGRIDENKGCKQLFDYYLKYISAMRGAPHLVLIGNSVIEIPQNNYIHHFGFLPEGEKFSALLSAELLIMPSFLESLSMVLLEAWALGKAVLVNGKCDVLKGQCIRSNAGLYYENYAEFKEALNLLINNSGLRNELGRRGKEFYEKNYSWDIIENKYERILSTSLYF